MSFLKLKSSNRSVFSRRFVSSLLCCFALGSTLKAAEPVTPSYSTAGFFSVDGSPRKVSNFNPGWRFYKGKVQGAEKVDFDDAAWEAAAVPHGLEILPANASGGRNYQGEAWYRKDFKVQRAGSSNRVVLYFEAVMGAAKVWVNGTQVAEHFGGYLPFAADITDVLNPDGQRNVVAVMADNSDDKSYLPGKNQGGLDFSYFGGIYRDCYLIETSSTHVTFPQLSKTVAGGGIFAATVDLKDGDAQLEVRSELKNHSPESKTLTLRTILEDADGNELVSHKEEVTLAAKSSQQLACQLTASKPRLWHTEDPYLHFIRTEVQEGGKVVDSLKTRIGIRLLEMRGVEGLFLNKKWIGKKLVGANRHQDYVYVGNALPNSGQWRDAKLLREGGCHVVRAGHYPLDPAFYDACDVLGMLTTTANPGWHFFNFKEPIFEERLYQDTRDLVRRDRNRPSIFLWETALNETPEQPGHAMNTMHKIAHEEFPFPGLYTVTDYHEAKKGGLDVHYHGTEPEVNSFNREYGDGGEVDNWDSQNAATRIPMHWGEKALLQQVMRQAPVLSSRFSTPKTRMGGSLWAGIEHQRGYHPDPFWGGLLDGFRRPKYLYSLYQSQYSPDYKISGVETGPMMFIANELTQLSPNDIVIFSNCDEIRLTWLGEEVGIQKPSTDGSYRHLPHPPFVFRNVFDFNVIKSKWRSKTKEIKLVAEAMIDGKVVLTQEKDYAQRTTGLKLSLADEGISLLADGSDFVPVRATIIDREGTKKVLAQEFITFKVEGPGEVIGGLANHGNPVLSEFGVGTALIRATTEPGKIKITAYAKGLKSDTFTIRSIAPVLPLAYDQEFAAASSKPQKDLIQISEAVTKNTLPKDVKKLQEEVKRLQLDLVGKQQDIMELRAQLSEK